MKPRFFSIPMMMLSRWFIIVCAKPRIEYQKPDIVVLSLMDSDASETMDFSHSTVHVAYSALDCIFIIVMDIIIFLSCPQCYLSNVNRNRNKERPNKKGDKIGNVFDCFYTPLMRFLSNSGDVVIIIYKNSVLAIMLFVVTAWYGFFL